jgi:biotin carboxylase
MKRVLLLATTTGYQTRAFGEAAGQLGVELVFAIDRCKGLDDPWMDQSIPIRFHDEDASLTRIHEAVAVRPVDGVLAVGDRPTVIAARAARALGLPWHSPEAAAIACNKERTRERLRDAGLPTPWFLPFALGAQPSALVPEPPSYPCVIKPVALSGSRGVMRADDASAFAAGVSRLRALLRSPAVTAEHNEAHERMLVEEFIAGREYALEGVMHHGRLHVLAIFDKPDPLDGPFFEETIYLAPSAAAPVTQLAIVDGVARAADAIGLSHGPVHAECRVNDAGVFVLEVAARPIGGLCARAVRLQPDRPLEEALLRHALGESPEEWRREESASGVMMIPIPRRGTLRSVEGTDAARAVPHIEDVRITAKPDEVLVPLPEGASYLGFIFARAARPSDVERALREAHARLHFRIAADLPVIAYPGMDYNSQHG